MRFQRFIQPVLVLAVAVTSLTACGRAPRTFDQLDVTPVTVGVGARPLPSPIIAADRAIELGEWLTAQRDAAIFSFARAVVASQSPQPVPAATVLASPSIASVMACIRGAESGNYGEASHPGSGSGAYQLIPSTFSAWASRAGYSGYAYAYEAPPSVQDAIVEYMLTHGGAGNWSNRYGRDGCTAGLPGGG